MTQEDKQLLLVDLCARMPYGVRCRFKDNFDGCEVDNVLHPDDITELFRHRRHCDSRIVVKPYLRPLSSMTEEETVQYCDLQDKFLFSSQYPVTGGHALFDWLNKKMFDYRGLIEKGLARVEKQKERELVNFDEAEKEKSDFVGDGFIRCFANFLDFKKGETYWLEYIGDDNYNVRSDNLLGKTYHITPCQLYTVFKKITWLEKQGEVAYNPYKETVKSIANMCDKYANKMNNEEDANDFLQNVKVKCKDAIEFEKQGEKNNQETAEDIEGTKVKAIDWEQRRYETAREIFANHFHGNITAAKAVEKADQLLEILKGGQP